MADGVNLLLRWHAPFSDYSNLRKPEISPPFLVALQSQKLTDLAARIVIPLSNSVYG